MTSKAKYTSILTKEFLIDQHHVKKISPLHIARLIGCDRQTVVNYLNYYEISLIPHQYPDRKMNRHNRWKGHGDISLTQYNNIKSNAKQRNIEFTVTIEELWDQYVTQQFKCALSGREIGFVHNRKGNASLDRKDSLLPYTKENVWWVHKDVNLAKQSLCIEDFIKLCKEVALLNL